MKYLAASMLCALLAGSAAVWAVPLPEQQVTGDDFVVVFMLKKEAPLIDPDGRVNVVVKATSEGDASIKAFRYVSGFIREERLIFLEAAKR